MYFSLQKIRTSLLTSSLPPPPPPWFNFTGLALHFNACRERATSSLGSPRLPMPSFGKRETRQKDFLRPLFQKLGSQSSFLERNLGSNRAQKKFSPNVGLGTRFWKFRRDTIKKITRSNTLNTTPTLVNMAQYQHPVQQQPGISAVIWCLTRRLNDFLKGKTEIAKIGELARTVWSLFSRFWFQGF